MDNTNYLLEFNIPGCSSGYEKFGNYSTLETSHIACFCCLATNIPVVNASNCNHTEFVKLFFKMKNATGLWICCICHYMLKKIELFRFQVYKSFNNLYRKVPQGDNNWKLINDLTLKNTSSVSISPTFRPEPEKLQPEQHKDPLEDTNLNNQQEIEVKIEPQYDSDTNSNNQDFGGSIETFTHTKTNIPSTYTCDTTNTETSQNLNLMKLINLTPIRPQKKENPMLKTMLSTEGPFSVQNYIKILPKPDSVPKSKAPNTLILQDTYVEDKIAGTQVTKHLNLVTAKKTTETQEQDDKIYNYLHKPSNVIDSTYQGKIMQLTITQEELDKERDNERKKETFQTAKYKCNSCVKAFEYEFVMDRHNARQHKEANPKLETVCTICKCVYSKATYKNHFKKHFTRFVCVVCDEESTDLPKLALHFNQSHPDKEPIQLSYWCNECDFKTDAVLKYRRHRKTHRTQKCNICNKFIYVKMRIHMKSYHSDETAAKKRSTNPPKSYKCEHCDRTYILPSTLRNHVRMCHGNDTNTYYCEKCDKQFKTEAIYRVHLTQSSAHVSLEDVFKYICDFCGKKTKYKDGMESHIEREHLKTHRFKCEPCNKMFAREKFLKRHINFVHNKHKLPKNKICQYCGKAFAIMPELKAHLLSHSDERPLSCEHCNKTYRHGSALRYHRKTVHKISSKRKID